ncbi:MAG: chromosomal replication initiator protein DnaA [Lachnospiraceae bacterium]|nr:chromosomal replication initiator protein DnaA [Lachnospiraceae bacterium]
MDNLSILQEKWPDIIEWIKEHNDRLTAVGLNIWILPLEIHSADNEGVTLIVPAGNKAINIINKRYTQDIYNAIRDVTGLTLSVHYITREQAATFSKPQEDPQLRDALEKARLNPKYTFESFVVGSNNKFAHAASQAVAEAPGEIYNPLYLYAGVGLGKTHLMHSIAHYVLVNNPDARVLYVTSEDFTNELIDSIRNGNNSAMSKFRDKYRNIDVLLIDDIQFIIGKESTQEEFFHTFEALYSQKKQIIISSDKPPKDLDILEERIRSRLEMGLIADISSPDYETRMAILRKKEEADGLHIDDAVLDYIAKNIKSNIRELEGCLNRVRAKSNLEKREVNLELAEEILRDLITPDDNRMVTSETIINAVAEHFNLTTSEIRSQKRKKEYVYPRMIAMYLCREMTDDALSTIASQLNKKDHTTVINAYNRISKDMETNPQTKNAVEIIRKKISPST